jgi:hypothetical protein
MQRLACLLLISTLAAQPAEPLSPPALGLIDPTFQPAANLRSVPTASQVVITGGRVGVFQIVAPGGAGRTELQLTWLNDDGTLHSTVVITPPDGPPIGSVRVIAAEPDGKILIAVDQPATEGSGQSSLLRLQADGSLDPSFARVAPFDYYSSTVLRRPGGGYALIDPPYVDMVVRGLTATGTADASFGGFFRFMGNRPGGMHAVMDDAGRTFLAINGSLPTYLTWEIVRLDAMGKLDPTFTRRTLPGFVHQFSLTREGLFYVAQVGYFAPPPGTITLGRLKLDGTDDPAWRPWVVATPSEQTRFLPSTTHQDFQLTPESGALLVTRQPGARHRFERIDPTGMIDRNYFAEIVLSAAAGSATLTAVWPLPDGRVYAFGNFDSVNGERRRHIVRLTPDRQYSATRVTNVSARAELAAGAPPLTMAFTLRGAGTRTILTRAVGPTLSAFGVRTPLADPSLTLMTGSVVVAANDNWTDAGATNLAALATQAGAFPLGAGSRDAAWTGSLGNGAHALQATTRDTTAGTVLGEWYDVGAVPADFAQLRLVNFSILGFTAAAERSLTAGFTVSGPNTKRLLIRVAGLALTAFGVSGAVANPQLEVYAGAARIAANDDWGGGTELAAAFQTVGAFAWPPVSNDAAHLITLPPGSYTVRAPGAGSSTGLALIEIYELP